MARRTARRGVQQQLTLPAGGQLEPSKLDRAWRHIRAEGKEGGIMNFKNYENYELERMASKLTIRGMWVDAEKLRKTRSTQGLSEEAVRIIREAQRPPLLCPDIA